MPPRQLDASQAMCGINCIMQAVLMMGHLFSHVNDSDCHLCVRVSELVCVHRQIIGHISQSIALLWSMPETLVTSLFNLYSPVQMLTLACSFKSPTIRAYSIELFDALFLHGTHTYNGRSHLNIFFIVTDFVHVCMHVIYKRAECVSAMATLAMPMLMHNRSRQGMYMCTRVCVCVALCDQSNRSGPAQTHTQELIEFPLVSYELSKGKLIKMPTSCDYYMFVVYLDETELSC